MNGPKEELAVKMRFIALGFVSCWLAFLVAYPARGANRGLESQAAGDKPQTYSGLEISVAGVERVSSVGLTDCPPGANTVKGMTKPGEEFAVVTVNFKVLPAFKPATALKKPVLNGVDGKSYNTAVSFVDVGSVPEFSCRFPYRMAQGTKLKSLQIDKVTFDLTKLDAPKP